MTTTPKNGAKGVLSSAYSSHGTTSLTKNNSKQSSN